MKNTFRLTAKIWSLFSLGFILMFLIGNALSPKGTMPTTFEWFMLICLFPGGVLTGIALAWKWEFIGSLLSISCLVTFYVIQTFVSGRIPGGPYFFLIAAPAFLFLISWIVSKEKKSLQ